jgi:tryptophan synthase beta subunit
LLEEETMSQTTLPDERGKFGPYGGQFVPETVMPALEEMIVAYETAKNDPEFMEEFAHLLSTYVGRPSPLSHAKRLSEKLGGAQIYLKREDLNHSGAQTPGCHQAAQRRGEGTSRETVPHLLRQAERSGQGEAG